MFDRRIVPFVLAVVCLATLAWVGRAHTFGTYETETDFYHYYAPDAERIAEGRFPENPYQPPGYPLTIFLVGRLTGDLFVAGKWVSIVSAALVVLLVYQLGARWFGYRTGVAAAALAAVGGQLPRFAIQSTTDLFFLALCLATYSVLTSGRRTARWRVGPAAALAGLAYLVRYNGLFLVAACLVGIVALNLFEKSLKERLALAVLFVAVFLAVASPWLYLNFRNRGSPFYNANYLNVATTFYRGPEGMLSGQDGTREMEGRFRSLGDVLTRDPGRIAVLYPLNLYDAVRRSLATGLVGPWVGWLAVLGTAISLIGRRSKAILLLLASVAIYFLLMAFNHWETRYYLFVAAAYAWLASHAVFRSVELLRERGWLAHRAFAILPAILLVPVWAGSLDFARRDVTRFLATQPAEIVAARDYLESRGVRGARILARKPHIPYLARQEWVFFPRLATLEELRAWLLAHPVDYVAFGAVERSTRPGLKALSDPRSAPVWLEPVWIRRDPAFVLYRFVPHAE